jgi:hypothetical protein
VKVPVSFSNLEAGLVVLVAALCVAFQLWIPSTHVADTDYQQVGQVLTQEGRPGDVILLQPWWTERARLFIPSQFEVVGFQGSEANDFQTNSRIWVLAQERMPRANMSGFHSAFDAQRTLVGAPKQFGNLTLSLYENGRSKPLLFSGFRDLQNVKKAWHEVNFEPLKCIRFDPPNTLDFVAPMAMNSLVIQAGYIWDRGTFVDGVTGSTIEIQAGTKREALGLSAGNPKLQTVSLGPISQGDQIHITSSAGNPNAREICLIISGFGAPGGSP